MKILLTYIILIFLFFLELYPLQDINSRLIIFEKVGQKEEIKINEKINVVYGKNIKTEYVYLNYIQGKTSDKYYLELRSIEPLYKEIYNYNISNDSLKEEISKYETLKGIRKDSALPKEEIIERKIKEKTSEELYIDSVLVANNISDENTVFDKMPKIKTLIDAVDYVRKQNTSKIKNNEKELNKIETQIDSINNIIKNANETGVNKNRIDQYLREIELLKLKKQEIQLLNEQLSYSNQILEKELIAKNAEYESLIRLIYIMILIILLILVLAITVYYSYHQKKKYNKQLSEINTQLETINKQLLQSNFEKENLITLIKAELNLASKYVISLLPSKIHDNNLKVDWVFKPSEELGGDSFGYHYIDRENFAIYLIDVSGHGVGAALHSVQVLNILQNSALPSIDFRKPDEVLNALNNIFQMNNYSGLYFTIFYAVFNVNNRTLTYSAAGHPPMLLMQKHNLISLESQNIFIGAIKNLNYTSDSVKLDKNDSLILFSDGAFELIDINNKVWTFEEFKTRLEKDAKSKSFSLQRVYDDNLRISNKNALDDDFSLIKISFL